MKRAIAIVCIWGLSLAFLFAIGMASQSAIQLLKPEQGITTSELPVFSFTTAVNATNCSLYVNDSPVATVNSVLENSVYNLSPQTLEEGKLYWFVNCNSNSSLQSNIRNLTYDSQAPSINVINPRQGATFVKDTVNVSIEVSESADCRIGSSNTSFGEMNKIFKTNGAAGWFQLVDLNDGDYTYYVKCRDAAGNIATESLNFSIKRPMTARIDIDTNIDDEGHYFLTKGRKRLKLWVSKRLEHSPRLYYQYEDGNKHEVALTGSGNKWRGYVIIDPKVNDKVAMFFASYDNEAIEITEGKLFVVDSQPPPAPSTLKGKDEANQGVALEWYYSGENVDYFRVYRSTSEPITHLDLLIETKDTNFIDLGAEPGVTYYYRISAVDLAGNEGAFSPMLKLTPGLDSKRVHRVNPKVVAKLNLTLKLLNELELDLNTAKQNLNTISELKTKSVVEEFGFIGQIDEKLKELELRREAIQNSYSQSEVYVDKQVEIAARFETEVKSKVVKGITFEGASEKTQAFSEDTARKAISGYLQQRGIAESQQYVNKMLSLNGLVDAETLVEVYKLTKLDDSESKLVKVQETLSYKGTDNVENVRLVETIPKAIASSSQELKISTLGYEIVKKDPIIEWDFNTLGFAERSVVYYVKHSVDMDGLDKLVSLYLSEPPENTTQETTGATGFSVKEGLGSGLNLHKLLLSFGAIIIASLMLYYLVLRKGKPQVKREDFSLPKLAGNRTLTEFNNLLRQGHALIDKLNYSASKQLYIYLSELLHTELGLESLGDAQKRGLKGLYTKLRLFRSIARAQSLLEQKDYEGLARLTEELRPMILEISQEGSKLGDYLQHWYYHYVNLVDFRGKK